MGEIVSLETLVAGIRDGMSLAIPTDHAGVAMAATAAIIANGPKSLHLVCVPISGIQADMLIGEGLIGSIETSAVTLGEAGGRRVFLTACGPEPSGLWMPPVRRYWLASSQARRAFRFCRFAASSVAT
jgi:hypothetical protein